MGPGDVLQKQADEQFRHVSDLKQQIAQMQIDITQRQKELAQKETEYNNAAKDQAQLQSQATKAKVAQKLMYGAGADPNRSDEPAPPVI